MSTPNITNAKCILIVGATSGIGRSLALALHDLPSQPIVIVAGRRQERLTELEKVSERIKSVQIDVTSGRAALAQFTKDIVAKYPDLDAVVFSSGIQRVFDFTKPETVNLDDFEVEVSTNYTSIVTLITFFVSHFLQLSKQGRPSFIVPITSGLGIIPAPWVPNYSSTKSALHAFSLSLDAQFRDTNIHVMEIIPPIVESELHDYEGGTSHLSNFWMSLKEFTPQVVEGLSKGDVQIPIGMASKMWEQFEKGKLEMVEQMRQQTLHMKK